MRARRRLRKPPNEVTEALYAGLPPGAVARSQRCSGLLADTALGIPSGCPWGARYQVDPPVCSSSLDLYTF